MSMFNIGSKYFFRTVTFHLVGEVTDVQGDWVRLQNASWVADSGRFHRAIQDGTLAEVEPVGDALVNTSTVTDAFPWVHDLPTEAR